MAFADLTSEPTVALLQRSLERGRLAHAYLLEGEDLDRLEAVARSLAKTVNCRNPVRAGSGPLAVDCCDSCPPCRHTDEGTHPDIHWLRPESKSRVIRAEQIRDLLDVIHLKANEDGYKVAILVGADRLNPQAANIFLKTLEEPPQKSLLLLLSSQPQRLLDTILSRCQRLRFGAGGELATSEGDRAWLEHFSEVAASQEDSLLARYRLLSLLLQRLAEKKEVIQKDLETRSPLHSQDDVDKTIRQKWETELAAAIESEYRHQRQELLRVIQQWLRDIWLTTLQQDPALLTFRQVPGLAALGGRIRPQRALDNLRALEQAQRLLHTNVQEALALEVCLLKLEL